jgi:predicted dehydrogenase
METVDKKLKVGVVGLGKMGLLHASLLSVMPNVQLAALCDKSWLMRKLAKSTLKGPLVTDKLNEMSNLNLDVVYVTTPIPSHYGIVKEIYAREIARNVFVEKTLSSNYTQSEELCKLAGASQGRTMVGYMKRFSVTFRKAKELLDQGVLGSVLSFDAYAYSSDFFGVQRDSVSGARGGVLEDLGCHVSDLAFWFFGDLLSSIKVSSSTDPRSDSVQFEVVGSNDFTGKFDISWAKEGYRMPEFGLVIRGTEGTIKVDDNELIFASGNAQPKTWYRQDLDDHVTFLLGESEYFRENDHFIKSIIFNAISEPNFQAATKVDYLLEQVRCKGNE